MYFFASNLQTAGCRVLHHVFCAFATRNWVRAYPPAIHPGHVPSWPPFLVPSILRFLCASNLKAVAKMIWLFGFLLSTRYIWAQNAPCLFQNSSSKSEAIL